ncbi:O-succinylbenzoic acid--CoA ligase [Friedmanniella endophytica]|uniref:O-succinylbenzoic acid--CoA ligase n=1 Tax=Microlunatus kandeliicorticis TaxID=1759536 RepID=A0A7W3P4D3_9ACTN|nr:AMP-binding protein [Microlunatus kandeliicorticis]MBA8792763.1 O-succinylbenzoic acid--CoA ligase [Microlunatus kandeliicorticis]
MAQLTTVPTDPGGLDRLRAELAAVLDGADRVLAPLPSHDLEREQALAMLQPDRPVDEDDAAVVVATSGSTGRPKGVVLTRDGIVASARATHRRVGGPGEWLLALPTHYVAGLMVVARAVVAGTPVVAVGADLSGLATLAPAERPRYLSVVPTQLVRALADPRLTRRLAALDGVLLGGAATPAELLDRARSAGVRVRTTYGMSETCGGCVYDGVPLDGVGIDLDDLDAERVGDGVGRVRITGAPVFAGYRLRPDLTAEVLDTAGGRRRFATSDRGRLSAEGTLEILGRTDDVVISGGVNVDLAAVERAAQQVLADPEAVAVGVADTEWGTRVVLVSSRDLDLTAVRGVLADRLPAAALPRQVVRRPVPRTSSGKPDRTRLVTELAAEPAATSPAGRP